MSFNLPTNATQWNNYFDRTIGLMEQSFPEVILGSHKYQCFFHEILQFKQDIFTAVRSTNIPRVYTRVLFEFFKAIGSLMSYISLFDSKHFLKYFLTNPLNQQFLDLHHIWNSFRLISDLMFLDSFQDITALNYAHYLDLIDIYKLINGELYSFNPKIKKALQEKLDEIKILLGKPPHIEEGATPGILSHDDFQTAENIGQGAFAQVLLASRKSDGTKFAVKELKQTQLNMRNILSLQRELNALLKLNHPNVLKFFGVTITPPFSIATAYVAKGSLFEVLHKPCNKGILNQTMRTRIAIGLARGLEYFAAMRFVHRDFKSHNILLDDNFDAIICDFGITRMIGPKMTYELGTVQYVAPELMVTTNETYDSAVDTYAFAIVLWELLTGRIPFQGMHVVAIANLVYSKDERPPIDDDHQCRIVQIIQHAWDKEPKRRPRMEFIRKKLETPEFFFPGTDKNEILRWIKQTKDTHDQIMRSVNDTAAKEESIIIGLIHQLNPLDSVAPKLMEKLFQFEYPISKQLFEDILKLVNQTLSIPAQEVADNVMKHMLVRNNTERSIDMNFIIDSLLHLIESQPQCMISYFRCIAPEIQNVVLLIDRIMGFNQSHSTVELLTTIIAPHTKIIDYSIVFGIYYRLPENLVVSFFTFMIREYGATAESLVIALDSLPLMSIFMKELAKACYDEAERVQKLINLPEVYQEGRASLQQQLDSISNVLMNPQTSDINEKTGGIIFKFLIQSCLAKQKTKNVLQLFCICARVGPLRASLSESNVWPILVDSLENKKPSMSYALDFIIEVPLPPDAKIRSQIWTIILKLYSENFDMRVAKCVASILKRSDENFELTKLEQSLLDGFNSENKDHQLSALKIARALPSSYCEKMWNGKFWEALIELISRKDLDVCRSMGKMACGMLIKMDNRFPTSINYVASTLNFLYDHDTPFESAYPSIAYLINSCKWEQMVQFLRDKYFLIYLHQLPFRYDDPRVRQAIDFCAMTLSTFSLNKS